MKLSPGTEEEMAAQVQTEVFGAYVRALKKHLATLSKKKLIHTCVHLAVELYNEKQKHQPPKDNA